VPINQIAYTDIGSADKGKGKGKGKGLHSYIRQRGQLSYSIKNQLQEEKEARLNKTPEKEARGNMKLMYEEEKNE